MPERLARGRFAPTLLLATIGIACAVALAVLFRGLGMTWNGVVLFCGVGIALPFALSAVVALLRRPSRIASQLGATVVAAICVMFAIFAMLVGRSR